jgi:phosphoglycerol transferase
VNRATWTGSLRGASTSTNDYREQPVRTRRGTLEALIAYVTAAAVSLVAAFYLLKLKGVDLHVPFNYGGDGLLFSLIVKSVVGHGWYLTNPDVGAPAGLDFHDYGVSTHDTVHLLLVRLLSMCSSDWGLVFNGYFLLGFPLITWSALAVLRRFGVSYPSAIACAVLYAFLPSRLLKGEGHLFLDTFFQVPLAILVLLWICEERPPFFDERVGARLPRLAWRNGRALGTLVICALVASTSAYYAFFVCVLSLAAGAWASFEHRSRCNAASGVAVAALVAIGLCANAAPTIAYELRHGANDEVGRRLPEEAEVYGLKIAELLLPVPRHRVPALRAITDQYDATAPLRGSETLSTSLGVVGGAGFLFLLAVAVGSRRPSSAHGNVLRSLSVLNLLAVLLGTIGGFGSIIAYLVTPQIRAYCRIHVLIGFLCLFAVALLLEHLRRWWPLAGHVAVALVVGFGLVDQVTPAAVPAHLMNKSRYDSDAELVRRIESTLAPGEIVFELPYQTFPEPPEMHEMAGYALIRPYLHSNSVRWSYPTMRGRPPDTWAQSVSQRDPRALVVKLAEAGIGGILVTRSGYADSGREIEAGLSEALQSEPTISRDHQLAFFALTDYRRRLEAGEDPEELSFRRYAASHPVGVQWSTGFFGVERAGDGNSFRWCGSDGELRIENDTNETRRIAIHMGLSAARPPAHLSIMGPLLTDALTLDEEGQGFARDIDVPPGRHVVRFHCDGARAIAPADPRNLVWRVDNPAIDDLRIGR